MSLINTKLQPFTATAFKNGEFVDVTDEDLLGAWSIVFFYPADFTFVCPTEVYSVSTDTHFTHKAWHGSSETIGKIQYAMIGDPTGTVSRNFDILREDEGLANRGTFVLDPDGVIQVMEVTAEGVGRNAAELVRKVRAAIYVRKNPGEVCPAKWEEGGETLAPSLDLVGKI